jgi:hypothetical protein
MREKFISLLLFRQGFYFTLIYSIHHEYGSSSLGIAGAQGEGGVVGGQARQQP